MKNLRGGDIMKLSAFGFMCACLFSIPQLSLADTIIYGANAYGRADMIEINLTQGTSKQVGSILFDTQAIDQDPASGFVYYFEWVSSGNELAYWDPKTSTNTRVRTYSSTPWGLAKRAAFNPYGVLYLMDDVGKLYTIDTATGDEIYAGQVQGIETGSSPFSASGDMTFSPEGTLYVVISENLYSIDIDMQPLIATLLYSNMIPGGRWKVWTGLAFCDGALYASDVDIFSSLSAIYSIDPSTGEVNQLFSTQTMLNDLSSCPADADIDKPPKVFITNPENGAVIAGSITISADVTLGSNAIQQVDFYVDGNVVASDLDAPYAILWDTTQFAEGGHTIRVTAVDRAALTSSASVNVTIVNAAEDVVFADSFENGFGNWVQDAQNDWFHSTQRAADGTYAAEVDGPASNAHLISPTFYLQGRTNALIAFSWYIESGLDSGEYLAFDVSTDRGSTWVEKARIRGNVDQENQWHAVSVDVILSPSEELTLQFRGNMSLYNEDANVDAVTVTAW
jgi:hypothetical protein